MKIQYIKVYDNILWIVGQPIDWTRDWDVPENNLPYFYISKYDLNNNEMMVNFTAATPVTDEVGNLISLRDFIVTEDSYGENTFKEAKRLNKVEFISSCNS